MGCGHTQIFLSLSAFFSVLTASFKWNPNISRFFTIIIAYFYPESLNRNVGLMETLCYMLMDTDDGIGDIEDAFKNLAGHLIFNFLNCDHIEK